MIRVLGLFFLAKVTAVVYLGEMKRRCFIKTSSFSAASLSILGTGAALAAHSSIYSQVYPWTKYSFEIIVAEQVVLITGQLLPANTDFEQLFINTYFEERTLTQLGPTLLENGLELEPPLEEHIIILVIAGIPPLAELPSVSVDVENLPNGQFRYTITNNHQKEIWISNKPTGNGW